MGIFEEIEKSGTSHNYEPLNLNRLNRVISRMDREGSNIGNKPMTMYGTVDTMGYMDSVLSGNIKQQRMYQSKFTAEAFRILKNEHLRLQKDPELYDVYCKLQALFKRHNSTLNMRWGTGIMIIFDPDYSSCELEVRLKNGKFDINYWYSDDTGYDQGEVVLFSDMEPYEVFDKLRLFNITL